MKTGNLRGNFARACPRTFGVWAITSSMIGFISGNPQRFAVSSQCRAEISFHRYPRAMDLARLIGHAFIENFGYRQLTAFWRIQAIVDYARGVKQWGSMQRQGFAKHG